MDAEPTVSPQPDKASPWAVGFRALAGGLLVVGLLAIMLGSRPSDRVYPQRKPVRFWHMWTGEWQARVEQIVRDFNASQDKYEVIPLSVPSGAEAKLQMGIVGGDPPDLMAEWNAVIPTWAQGNLLQPFDPFMGPVERKNLSECYPILRRIATYRGKVYALPIGLNMLACYARKDFLAEAGFDPENWVPKTMQELLEAGKKLERRDRSGKLVRMGFSPPDFNNLATGFGGGLWNWAKEESAGRGELRLDSAENLRALEMLAKERKRVGFDEVVRFSTGQGADTGGGWSFIQGMYAIIVNGQWRVEQLRKYAPNVRYRVFAIPPPAGYPPGFGYSGGNLLVMPRGAKNPEGGWAFATWWSGLTNPDTAAKPFADMAQMPPSPAVANSKPYQEMLRQNPEMRKFVDILPSPRIQTLPPVPYQMFLLDKVYAMEDRVLRGTLSPKAGQELLVNQVRDELARRKALGYPE